MIDSQEFVNLQQNSDKEKDFKLATVMGLFDSGTAKIQFFGEESISEKEYSYLARYNPAIGDTVLLIPFLDTYIIADKVMFQVTVENEEYITNEQLTAALNNYVKTTDLSEYAKKTELNDYIKSGDSVSSLTVSNLYTNRLGHTGSLISFFNGGYVQKQSINRLASNADLSQVISKVNGIIGAFENYNLL